ncbi:MAG: hypothetical protein E4H40_05635 [Candidatus Brocadiia bacterium]|nr:MAG: hypothetical protein E4H40_05635 [Candidatus Brocadiia bacterium]
MKNKGVFSAAILTAVLFVSGNVLAVLSGAGTAGNLIPADKHNGRAMRYDFPFPSREFSINA